MSTRVRSSLAFLALAIYFAILVTHLCIVAGGSDSSGYLNEAKLIATFHNLERITALDEFHLDDSLAPCFIPLGYTASGLPRMTAPTYPPGVPMQMALLAAIGG